LTVKKATITVPVIGLNVGIALLVGTTEGDSRAYWSWSIHKIINGAP